MQPIISETTFIYPSNASSNSQKSENLSKKERPVNYSISLLKNKQRKKHFLQTNISQKLFNLSQSFDISQKKTNTRDDPWNSLGKNDYCKSGDTPKSYVFKSHREDKLLEKIYELDIKAEILTKRLDNLQKNLKRGGATK